MMQTGWCFILDRMRIVFGYILGFLVFIAGIPALMWLVSGRPFPYVPARPLAVVSGILIVSGLVLSVWSIFYMKKVGEGNPFDAYNHEVAPRTRHLMTDGPYRYTRNPMLVGVYINDIGIILWLSSWWPPVIFALEVLLLSLQVRSEEKRLEADFCDGYRSYKQTVPRYFPYPHIGKGKAGPGSPA